MFLQDAWDFLPILLKGAVVTVQVTAGSFLLSSVIGLLFALMMVSKIRAIALFAIGVVNVIRGLPIIVQLFYIYFVLPDFGIQLSAMQAGVIGLTPRISFLNREKSSSCMSASAKGCQFTQVDDNRAADMRQSCFFIRCGAMFRPNGLRIRRRRRRHIHTPSQHTNRPDTNTSVAPAGLALSSPSAVGWPIRLAAPANSNSMPSSASSAANISTRRERQSR